MKSYLRTIDTHTRGPRYDVTPLFADRSAFKLLVKDLTAPFRKSKIDGVACIDALGFILGTAVALELRTRIIPLRKNGKLPVPADRAAFRDYTGRQKGLELRKKTIRPGECILLVDEWIETGAQINAAIRLIQKQKGKVAAIASINMDKNRRTDLIRRRHWVHTVWSESTPPSFAPTRRRRAHPRGPARGSSFGRDLPHAAIRFRARRQAKLAS